MTRDEGGRSPGAPEGRLSQIRLRIWRGGSEAAAGASPRGGCRLVRGGRECGGKAPAGHEVAGVPGGGASRPRGAKLRAWGFARRHCAPPSRREGAAS